MELSEYQKKAYGTALHLERIRERYSDENGNSTIPKDIEKLLGIYYCGLGLGEVGEIQGKLKKILRDSGGVIINETKLKLRDEIGDALWYVAALCTELGFDLNDVAQRNLEKSALRKKNNTIRGSGDNR